MRASRREPAGDLHLLLVAAGKRSHLGIDAAGLDLQRVDLVDGDPARAPRRRGRRAAPAPAGSPARCCRRPAGRRSGSRGGPAPSGPCRGRPRLPDCATATVSPSIADLAGAARPARRRRSPARPRCIRRRAGRTVRRSRRHERRGRGRATRVRRRSPGSKTVSPRTSRTASPTIGASARGAFVSMSPIISATISGRETSRARWSPRMAPSRITTMRSEIAKTSARRCETKMTATPRALQGSIRANRWSDSFSVNAAVGSSRMRRRAFFDSARAMTTSCCAREVELGRSAIKGSMSRSKSRAHRGPAPGGPERRSCPSASERR